MPLKIGNKFLIPAPIVNFQENFVFNDDGTILNKVYAISLNGTILPNMGSPGSTGWHTDPNSDPSREAYSTDTEKFNSILAKQELLRKELAATGVKYSYYPSTTGTPVEFYPSVKSISFAQGTWVIKCDYSIELETPIVNRSGSVSDDFFFTSGSNYLNLTSANDSYQITENTNGTQILEVSRSIAAKSAIRYNTSGSLDAWKNARSWVLSRRNNVPFNSGYISIIPTGLVYNSGTVYNVIEEESIDQLGGSYSLTQKFLYHHQNYIDVRSISRNIAVPRVDDGGPRIETISINGTIQGLDANNVSTNKLTNASGYFNTLVSNIATLIGATGTYVSYSRNEDIDAGSIAYSFDFIYNSGQLYKHNYDVNYTFGNDDPLVTINGTIEGYTPDDNFPNKFTNALSGWNVISTGLKILAFQYPDLTPSGAFFGNLPLNKTIAYNKPNGTITYNYSYAYTSGVSLNYKHNYSIDINTENAPTNSTRAGLLCTANINGQIQGLSSGNDPNSKLANAKIGFSLLLPTIFTLVNNEFSLIGTNTPPLNSGFLRRTLALDQRNGSINYTASFNNFPATSHSLVAVEDVTVEDTNPQDIHAIQIIPGRASGPIIQNIGTINEKRRSINIALTLYPSGSPYYFSYSDKSLPASIASGIASGLLPPGVRGSGWWLSGDSENWNWKNGFYTRSMSIVY